MIYFTVTKNLTFLFFPLHTYIVTFYFQILITAENHQTTSYAGGFAIDDIRFDNCAYDHPTTLCESDQGQCKSGHCYPMENKCDFTKDCCLDSTDELECGKYESLFHVNVYF